MPRKKKLDKQTGTTFIEEVITTAGEGLIKLLLKKLFGSKSRGAQQPFELTDEQVDKLNELRS